MNENPTITNRTESKPQKKHQLKTDILKVLLSWVVVWLILDLKMMFLLPEFVGNLIWQVYQSLLGVGTLSQGLFTRFGGEQYLFDLLKYLVWPKYLICSKNLICLISFFSYFFAWGRAKSFSIYRILLFLLKFFCVVKRPGKNLFVL